MLWEVHPVWLAVFGMWVFSFLLLRAPSNFHSLNHDVPKSNYRMSKLNPLYHLTSCLNWFISFFHRINLNVFFFTTLFSIIAICQKLQKLECLALNTWHATPGSQEECAHFILASYVLSLQRSGGNDKENREGHFWSSPRLKHKLTWETCFLQMHLTCC